MTTSWYLLQLKPNTKAIAERNLLRQKFDVLFPLQEVTVRQRSKFATRKQLLFPGYGFVGFDPAKGGWRAINSTHGVARLVSFGKDPKEVPLQLIAELKRRCDPEGLLLPAITLKAGDKVQILKGPFADFVATVDKIEPEKRVYALMELMGRETKVAVDPRNLRSA